MILWICPIGMWAVYGEEEDRGPNLIYFVKPLSLDSDKKHLLLSTLVVADRAGVVEWIQ